MPIVWNTATSKKVYFAHSVDVRESLTQGYQLDEPAGGQDAYVIERADDTVIDLVQVAERARLGHPVSSADRDKLADAWIESELAPLSA